MWGGQMLCEQGGDSMNNCNSE